MATFKVFYSWQSDLDQNDTRSFIRDCIDEAIDLVADTETIEAVRDEATLNVTGSPNIVTTLFSKIDECKLFVADVSCCYSCNSNKGKSSPNPNVMLELGYAAKAVGWERIICICNSQYGEDLPFDIAHNRITRYSFSDKHSRREEKHRIARIIFKNIRDLRDKPMITEGVPSFILGSYDMEHKAIQHLLFPVDLKQKTCYSANTEIVAKRIRELVSEINVLTKTIENENGANDNEKKINPDYTLEDKDVRVKDFTRFEGTFSLTKKEPIILTESDEIRTILMELLDIGVTEVFFNVGSLAHGLPLPSIMGESLIGSDAEKGKYYKLLLLNEALKTYQARLKYPESFDGLCFFPIAIQNTSNVTDEDIRIVIQSVKGTFIDPYDTCISDDCRDLCGFLCESYDDASVSAIRDLFGLQEDGFIQAEGNHYPCTNIKDPVFQEWQGDSCKDEASYYAELEGYIEEPAGEGYYDFEISKLRPRECKWLGKGLLIKPENGEIAISYQIYSAHSTGENKGELVLAAVRNSSEVF